MSCKSTNQLAAAEDRRSCAKEVQQMMVTVLEAEGDPNDAGMVDCGSDCGDCMDEGSDTEVWPDNEDCMEFLDDVFDLRANILT